MQLNNKHILVAGGTSGIGLAAARYCAEKGAKVMAVGKPNPELQSVEGRLEFEFLDLTEESNCSAAIETCVDRLGDLDGLFHVAGGSGRSFGDGPLHSLTLDAWRATFQLNLETMMMTNRAAIRFFLNQHKGGSIVNLSSVLAAHPSPAFFSTHAYAAAKAAAIGLSTAAAAHYAQHNIRVNVIAPGLVETPMSARASSDPAIQSFITTKQPLDGGRIGRPEDISAMATLLLSDEASFITGQTIHIDGGWSVSEGQHA